MEAKVMSDEAMGDCLDLEKEFTYPRSDGSHVSTIDCHKLAEISFKSGVQFVVDWFEKNSFNGEERHPDGTIPVKGVYRKKWQAFKEKHNG